MTTTVWVKRISILKFVKKLPIFISFLTTKLLLIIIVFYNLVIKDVTVLIRSFDLTWLTIDIKAKFTVPLVHHGFS